MVDLSGCGKSGQAMPWQCEMRSEDGRGAVSSQYHDLNALISSAEWLRWYGLKQSKLRLCQILANISFKHTEEYVHSLRKCVSSQYACGMFPQFTIHGSFYNLTASQHQLKEICTRLENKAELYQRRLAWLTTDSRQLFGVIQEKRITVVVDFGNSPLHHQRGKQALSQVIHEQVSQLDSFNIICSGINANLWRQRQADSNVKHLQSATDWLWALEPETSCSISLASALSKAMEDTVAEAVYLFAIGDFGADITNIPSKRPVGNVCPVHTVSFNAKLEKTILALKQLSFVTAGRFHAFAEISVFVDELRDSSQNKAECEVPEFPTKLLGGMPPGCGVREDVYLVWAEKAEALQIRDQIQAMLTELYTPSNEPEPDLWYSCSSDACLDSRQWLEQFGLKAQRLTIYDALASCAFYHSDGIVDIKSTPADENLQSDAETCKKLINAKYCSGFVHMRWKDGSVVHVYVTAEKCRQYEEKMLNAIEVMSRRIDWLREGSRALFGNIPEQRVYILLDTSESMRRHLPWLKENISQLLEEQLCQGQRVNMLVFGTHVVPWRDTLTQLSPPALISARHWLDKLQAGGSTNTLGALSLALAAEDTEAVYLLMDGRPDQPAKDILEEVRRGPPVPVHTISFNCDDQEANRFLQELSMETSGRFLRYFTDPQEASGGQGHLENEDLQLLRAEIEEGRRDLESVRRLRAECILLDTFHHGKMDTNQKVSQGPERQSCQGSERDHQFSQRKSPRCTAASAAQTKSSLRRLLASGGSIASAVPQGWLLPESLELFQTNADKQMQVLHNLGLTSDENKQKKKRRKVKPKKSLETSTAEWLKANSLAGRKLTLLDAVAPAAIAHNATYVPMLEKHVYSKVFNEVLHLAHISKGGTQKLTLINPLAINLEDYKSRLSKALQDYESRLNMIAWRALPQEEKDKFGSEPVGFMERREEVLEVLESLGWPVAQEELSALEEQIRAGRDFLQQATELQSVSRKAAQDAQTAIHRSHKDTPPKSHPDAPKRPVDSLRGQKVVAWSEANGAYCYGIARKCLPGKRVKVDFLSATSEVVPLSQVLTVGGSAPCPPLAVADYVLVDIRREDRGEHFVPGVVIATPRRLEAADKFYTILKFNNKEVDTYRNKIIKISQDRYRATCGRLAQLRISKKTK